MIRQINNTSGKLGLGDVSHRGDGANEMGDNLLALKFGKSKNKIATESLKLANMASLELFEQTGQSNTLAFTGGYHSCAILENGNLKCWGENTSGKLGVEDANHWGDGAGEMGDSLPAIDLGTKRGVRSLISSGNGNFTCALWIIARLNVGD